ncbi:MAG TPA: MFS transporter [Acidimicrobiia bacterium]|jgi:EmrB/QacA subfamily drug resistance transporter|nr:MFS transporter [Acidimicrobiia bacterium]
MTSAVAPPELLPFDRTTRSYRLRWWVLGVLCLSLLVIIVDNSILNVALPHLQTDLHATFSQLQWMVDSYTLVFACLLLTAGSLGDRFGRKGALQLGMVVFGAGSLLSAFATSPSQLIATRAIMGIGGAFIMPSTLSLITNVFPPEERGRAISYWAAIAGVGVALGPISGGLLLEHFYWGSIFLVNLPIVAVALTAGVYLLPKSRDPSHPRLDLVGASLSIVGLLSLVYGIIEGPTKGWTSTTILGAFAIAAVVLGAFAWWELKSSHPMLNLQVFENARFSAASLGIMLIFFAMFGSTFLLTQYLQSVMGFSALRAGAALLPWAAIMLVVAPLSARLSERFGSKLVVGTGMSFATLSLLLISTLPSTDISYLRDVLPRLVLMAIGMGLVMAPATESIMGSLPRAKAGVGSAMNDTTRQVGGALGVAVVGSVMLSVYGGRVGDAITNAHLPVSADQLAQARQNLSAALGIAHGNSGLVTQINEAFVAGMHRGVLFAAAATLVGAIVVFRYLPAHGKDAEQLPESASPDEIVETPAALEPA